jgi:hypothetical protein
MRLAYGNLGEELATMASVPQENAALDARRNLETSRGLLGTPFVGRTPQIEEV